MTEETIPACPHCGGTHSTRAAKLTFQGAYLEAIELMAARRKEDIGQFLYHLLWLESAKVPRARQLLEHGDQEAGE